jgi:hypothetical protein
MKIKIITKAAAVRIGIFFGILAILLLVGHGCMLSMPGKSYTGELVPLTTPQQNATVSLQADVEMLAKTIGHRNVLSSANLARAADHIEKEFTKAGYTVNRIGYKIDDVQCDNLEVQIAGVTEPNEIVVIGAHYDSVLGSVGANDNASGVAALLQLARTFADKKPAKTLRFVAFVNEEPPYFWTEQMGSLVYARHCRQRGDNIMAMIAFDCLGCYFDEKDTQKYPFPFSLLYPSTGNFIGFVGNFSSRHLVRQVVGTFRATTQFPSEGVAMFEVIPGVGWSDQWSFWQCGYKGLMVTDTALFRYPYYHKAEDTPDKIDYQRLARVADGIEHIINELTGLQTTQK